eukprot:1725784-Pleurochrysis_carterae.AAC.1
MLSPTRPRARSVRSPHQCEVDLVAEPLAQIRGQLDANVAASDDDHAHGRGTETARQERLAQLRSEAATTRPWCGDTAVRQCVAKGPYSG